MLIGCRQLGLAILMHDGAHGCLSREEARHGAQPMALRVSDLSRTRWPIGGIHLAHHAHTQQPEDPDLVLSAPFPITRRSYRRKFWRDITGRTGYSQRKAQFLNALGDASWPFARRVRHFAAKLGPQLAVNAVLAAASRWPASGGRIRCCGWCRC